MPWKTSCTGTVAGSQLPETGESARRRDLSFRCLSWGMVEKRWFPGGYAQSPLRHPVTTLHRNDVATEGNGATLGRSQAPCRSRLRRRSSMTDRLLSPSKITAWLDCAHYLTLRERADAGLLDAEPRTSGASPGCSPTRGPNTRPTASSTTGPKGAASAKSRPGDRASASTTGSLGWAARGTTGHDVISQMPFVHDGMRGIADFLVRVDGGAGGASTYEPVDAKLARVEAKPGHVLQLCFYADALARRHGCRTTAPAHLAGVGAHRVARRPRVPALLAAAPRPIAPAAGRRGAHAGHPRRHRVPTASSASSPPCVTPSGATRTRSSTSPASGRATGQSRGRGRLHARRSGEACRRRGLDAPRATRAVGLPGRAPGRGEDRPRRLAPVPSHRGRRRPGLGSGSRAAPGARRRGRLLGLRRRPVLDGGQRPVLPLRAHRTGCRRRLGLRAPDGPTTGPRRSGRRGTSSSTWRTAGPSTRTCTSTTTTTRSDRPSSAWPPITASARRCCPRWWPRDSSSTSIRWSATPSRSAPSPTD